MKYDGVRGLGLGFVCSLFVTLAGPYATDSICLALGALIVISEPLMFTWISASAHTHTHTNPGTHWRRRCSQLCDLHYELREPVNVSLEGSGACVCVCVALFFMSKILWSKPEKPCNKIESSNYLCAWNLAPSLIFILTSYCSYEGAFSGTV